MKLEYTYEELRSENDTIVDLVDAYAKLAVMLIPTASSNRYIEQTRLTAWRVLLNPAYHTSPEKFPFIKPQLKRILDDYVVEEVLDTKGKCIAQAEQVVKPICGGR